MLYLAQGLLPLSCVLSRGVLHIVDRYMLGIQKLDIHFQQWVNTVCPFILGLIVSPFFCSLSCLEMPFLQVDCFLTALLMILVSYAFSLSFKERRVREVVISAKLADLLFIPILGFLFFTIIEEQSRSLLSSSEWIAYLVGYCSCLPLIFGSKKLPFKQLPFFLHPTSLFLMASLCIQFFFALLFTKDKISTFEQGWLFTMGILLWRTLFSTAVLFFSRVGRQGFNEIQKRSYQDRFLLLGQVVGRSCLMLIAYATFVFSIELKQPMLVFPILNSGVLVSAVLAQIILKEKLLIREVIAIIGLTFSSIFGMFQK